MKQLKVLLVEDEAMLALAFSASLRKIGYNMLEPVATGESAIQSALENDPDVILMDIHLAGEMDGIEAAEKILAKRSFWIIFITGYSTESIQTRAQALKPVAYLVKPIIPPDVTPYLEELDNKLAQH